VDTARPLRIALLAVPESTASTLYGMYDLLAGAGRDWPMVTGQGEPATLVEPMIVSRDGQPFAAANGVMITPASALDRVDRVDVVVIPDLFVLPDTELAGRYESESAWLAKLYREGATLTAACTGALLLAESGVLDGQDVTTHWAYCDAMAERYPAVRMQANRALVTSGEGQRLILAGGGTSWHDLALYLIARFVGVDEAMRLARLHLLDWHHVGQQPFATLSLQRQVSDALIARCQAWIAEHYDADAPVRAMVAESGLAERSFKRRFTRATGMSPLEYVHTLRLEETKQMLESTDMPVEQIAQEVGYEDASFFGRLFRRKVGLTPAQYRRRFQSLRRQLEVTTG
jgi:transcriptional regulator GlxA family with amidase domain